MAIPTPLVPTLRAALEASGFPGSTVANDGTINPAGFLAGVYDTVEFRTMLSPPIKFNTRDLLAQGGAPNPFVGFLKPTVILSGPNGQNIIAPVGAAGTAGTYVGLFAVAAIFALGFATARLLK